MSGPFTILPGSDAEQAVSQVLNQTVTPDNLAEVVSQAARQHGVDSMSSDAIAAAANQLQQTYVAQHPIDQSASPLVQRQQLAARNQYMKQLGGNMAGTAVADPNVVARWTQGEVNKLPDSLSDAQKQEKAIEIAGQGALKAGASAPAAQAEAQALMDNGVPPSMAAVAAVQTTAGKAVSKNSEAAAFEIYGYLKAIVHGLVTETYLSEENKTVTGLATHTYDNNLYLTTNSTLTINCLNYRALAEKDTSIAASSIAEYKRGYTMTAPNPISYTGVSGTLYWGFSAVTGYGHMVSLAATKCFILGVDVYGAALTFDKTSSKESEDIKTVQFQKKGIGVWLNLLTGFI